MVDVAVGERARGRKEGGKARAGVDGIDIPIAADCGMRDAECEMNEEAADVGEAEAEAAGEAGGGRTRRRGEGRWDGLGGLDGGWILFAPASRLSCSGKRNEDGPRQGVNGKEAFTPPLSSACQSAPASSQAVMMMMMMGMLGGRPRRTAVGVMYYYCRHRAQTSSESAYYPRLERRALVWSRWVCNP